MKIFKRTLYVILTLCSVTLDGNYLLSMKRKEPCGYSNEEISSKIQQIADEINLDIASDFLSCHSHIPLTLYQRQGGTTGSIATELLAKNPDRNTLNNLFDQLTLEYYLKYFNADLNLSETPELISIGTCIKEMLLTKFLFACYKQRKNCFSAMNVLISLGAHINHRARYSEENPSAGSATLLIEAVNKTDLKAIEFFIDKGAHINGQDKLGKTALRYAIIAHGANLDRKKQLDETDETKLSQAYYNIINFLLKKGASIKLKDNCNNTDLHEAAMTNDLALVSLLVNLSENLNTPPLLSDAQALEEATNLWVGCPLDILNYCIKPHLFSCKEINQQNVFGLTPLMYAASHDNFDMVKYLLDHGGDASLVSSQNKTAYDMATDSKVKELLAASL